MDRRGFLKACAVGAVAAVAAPLALSGQEVYGRSPMVGAILRQQEVMDRFRQHFMRDMCQTMAYGWIEVNERGRFWVTPMVTYDGLEHHYARL